MYLYIYYVLPYFLLKKCTFDMELSVCMTIENTEDMKVLPWSLTVNYAHLLWISVSVPLLRWSHNGIDWRMIFAHDERAGHSVYEAVDELWRDIQIKWLVNLSLQLPLLFAAPVIFPSNIIFFKLYTLACSLQHTRTNDQDQVASAGLIPASSLTCLLHFSRVGGSASHINIVKLL